MDNEIKNKIEASYRIAEEFTKHYYQSIDKRRHLMNRFYLDSGILAWNGNGVKGKDAIQQYLIELPTTVHIITSLDIHPLLDEAVAGQITYLIQSGGSVKYEEHPVKPFQQTFVITAEGDKWKIVSDAYRLQESLAATQS